MRTSPSEPDTAPAAAPLILRYFPKHMLLAAYDRAARDEPFPTSIQLVVIEAIERTTHEEIRELASEFLDPSNFSLTVLGPVGTIRGIATRPVQAMAAPNSPTMEVPWVPR